jgi:hypothetical protein
MSASSSVSSGGYPARTAIDPFSGSSNTTRTFNINAV